VILKALANLHLRDICIPIIYGSAQALYYQRKYLGLESVVNLTTIGSAWEAKYGTNVYVVNCTDEEARTEFGISTKQAGRIAYESLNRCCEEYKRGMLGAMVTAPINKENIQSEEFTFPGHTEFLGRYFAEEEGAEPLMILGSDRMKVALVTTHIPISKVAESITKEKIMNKISILHKSLEKDFATLAPKIAVLGLNPHVGDNGLLGTEDKEIILPAIQEMQEKGCFCFGPYSPDGFFGAGNYTKFDAILAMYHDQGLIPFKLISMEEGYNFTAGLPVIRTSPDHGTAYDIAGKNKASERSFVVSLYTAIDIYNNRVSYEKIHANPLQKQIDKRAMEKETSPNTEKE
ncbi:MAG TPA: 4-hydroxythreonine-4-phosphate dehydrogenase PdxA, partial [Porphyromonadaceae bacterium]|nr:4-hydroxythreonine-4-phosphate dehydrogenase PdxA [Porphyromonadaceae bacterium]